MTKPYAIGALALPAVLVLSASPAAAHAFGQRYDLPLPLWLYTTGAGATVALSFVVMALFFHRRRRSVDTLSLDLLLVPGLSWLGHPWTVKAVQAVSVGVFALISIACFVGNADPFDNIAPTFVWVVWWVGFAFLSALLGNVWDLVNPWRILFEWGARLSGRRVAERPYPDRLGYWPAVVFFLVFAWMELISESAEKPPVLGILIVAYSLLTWSGMAWFGCRTWLRYGDVFSVAFGVLAWFAPLRGSNGKLLLRFPASGLLVSNPVPISLVGFVLLLLTSVTFDGILETPLWQSLIAAIAESTTLRGTLLFLQREGINLLALIKTLALVVTPAIFAGVFLSVSCLIGKAGSFPLSWCVTAGSFVLSLVPIAIAYHLSHYLSYLLIAGQNIIPLASDPFGAGWELFGTRGYRLDIGIVNARMVWFVSVTAIVAGHVIAVYVAHVMALRVFPTVRQAIVSQVPMMALMVAYTMVSLWILSQPIVE
jgi:hypothetical protein